VCALQQLPVQLAVAQSLTMDEQRLRVLEDFVEEECIPAEPVFDAQVRLRCCAS
jgi:hypothetical protein